VAQVVKVPAYQTWGSKFKQQCHQNKKENYRTGSETEQIIVNTNVLERPDTESLGQCLSNITVERAVQNWDMGAKPNQTHGRHRILWANPIRKAYSPHRGAGSLSEVLCQSFFTGEPRMPLGRCSTTWVTPPALQDALKCSTMLVLGVCVRSVLLVLAAYVCDLFIYKQWCIHVIQYSQVTGEGCAVGTFLPLCPSQPVSTPAILSCAFLGFLCNHKQTLFYCLFYL
jgi:hypothetical protein